MAQEKQTIGNVYLSGDELQLSFRFCKRRFAAIKSMKGATYNKDLKRWCLPVTALDNLLSSKLFSENFMRYAFDQDLARQNAAAVTSVMQEANIAIDQNPFEVEEDCIAKADLDCVIRSATGGGLRVFIKKRSKAKKIIEEVRGAHYIKVEGAYFLPTLAIKKFLCTLRDQKLRFAVAKETALKLKVGAETRNTISSSARVLTARELKDGMLYPYLAADFSAQRFVLHGSTQEQLAAIFPHLRGALSRERAAAALTLDKVAFLVTNLEKMQVKIWFSSEVLECLNESLAYFSEELQFLPQLLALLGDKREAVWICDYQGAGLLFQDDEILLNTDAFSYSKHVQFPNYKYIRPAEEKLPQFFKEVQDKNGSFKKSPAFEIYYQDLLERLRLRERCRKFNTMRESEITLSDTELQKSLFPHQRVAVEWLLETEQAFLGDDMGLGKTLSILAAFQELHHSADVSFLLVVAPNSLVLNWYREAKRWTPKLRFAVLPDSPQKKKLFLRDLKKWNYYHGLIVNYEKIRLDYVYPAIADACKSMDVMLCLDESQRVKNPTSMICKALKNIAPLCKRRVLLSGTPTPRDLADIWSQMLLLDGGKRFGVNYYTWLTSVAEVGNQWSDYAVKRFIPEKVNATIARVQELLLRRKKSDVIDLPEKLFSVRDLEMSGDQERRYEEVRKDLLLQVSAMDGTTSVKQIESILEEYLRAVQIASNPRIVDENWSGDPVKFVELDEIVAEVVEGQGGKIVIWTNFKVNVHELVKRYAKYSAKPFMGEVSVKERDKTVKEFQDPTSKVKILVAIPAAGGVGITLTAAQTAVYLEKTWNAEHWQQSIDRIHRIGQRGTVTIISLQACPVDGLIAANLAKKMRAQARLLGDTKNRSQLLDDDSLLPSRAELLAAVTKVRKKVDLVGGAEDEEITTSATVN